VGEREHYNEMWNLASNYLANSADFGPAKLAQLGCFTAQGHSEVGVPTDRKSVQACSDDVDCLSSCWSVLLRYLLLHLTRKYFKCRTRVQPYLFAVS